MNHYRMLVEDVYRRLITEARSAKAESAEQRHLASGPYFEGKEMGLYIAVTTLRDQLLSWGLEIDPVLANIDLDSELLSDQKSVK